MPRKAAIDHSATAAVALRRARTWKVLNASSIAQIERNRRECYYYLASSEHHLRKKLQNG